MNFNLKKDFEILETDLLTHDSFHNEYVVNTKINSSQDCQLPILAFNAFLKFREELACRKDVKYTASRLGGNVNQYFLLLSPGIKCKEIFYKKILGNDLDNTYLLETEDLENIVNKYKENPTPPNFYLDNGKIIFEYDILSKTTVLELRNLFDKFITDFNIELPNITEEQIISLDYMLRFKDKSLSLNIYLKCLDACHCLNRLLNDESSMNYFKKSLKDFNSNYLSEKKHLILSFAKKCGFLEVELKDSFSNSKHYMSIFKKDDVFKNELNELFIRYELNKNTFINSFFDIKNCKLLSIVPKYISLFPIRKVIGIERLVEYHLDDYLLKSEFELNQKD